MNKWDKWDSTSLHNDIYNRWMRVNVIYSTQTRPNNIVLCIFSRIEWEMTKNGFENIIEEVIQPFLVCISWMASKNID